MCIFSKFTKPSKLVLLPSCANVISFNSNGINGITGGSFLAISALWKFKCEINFRVQFSQPNYWCQQNRNDCVYMPLNQNGNICKFQLFSNESLLHQIAYIKWFGMDCNWNVETSSSPKAQSICNGISTYKDAEKTTFQTTSTIFLLLLLECWHSRFENG